MYPITAPDRMRNVVLGIVSAKKKSEKDVYDLGFFWLLGAILGSLPPVFVFRSCQPIFINGEKCYNVSRPSGQRKECLSLSKLLNLPRSRGRQVNVR